MATAGEVRGPVPLSRLLAFERVDIDGVVTRAIATHWPERLMDSIDGVMQLVHGEHSIRYVCLRYRQEHYCSKIREGLEEFSGIRRAVIPQRTLVDSSVDRLYELF
jgi:hypothetical protein